MREQDLKHKEGIEEIQNIIDSILRNEGEEMRKQVNQEIADQIDEIVKEQVAQCLKDHIPEDVQRELAENKREYELLQRALHNSESRRLNRTLRADNPDSALHTIQMADGNVSEKYPKDLKELFSLDANALETLMSDYEITGTSNSRDANLNKFMQFCGVRYQFVKTKAAKPDNASTAF
jgi:plasmid stabilization system protein ParE